MVAAKSKKSRGASKKPRKVRPMQQLEFLRVYNSEPLGICVGVPLNLEGDVLTLYEGGTFCARVRNLSRVGSKPLPVGRFLPFLEEQLGHARSLQRIRELLGEDSGSAKVEPHRFLKRLLS